MTQQHLRNGLSAGMIFGVILIFLALTGFSFTSTELIGSILKGVEEGSVAAMAIFVGALGLWAGRTAARSTDKDTWLGAGFSGLVAGALSGLIIAVFLIVFGRQVEAGVNLRRYLPAMSKEAIELMLLGRGTIPGAVANIVLLSGTALAGGLLTRGLGRSTGAQAVGSGFARIRQNIASMPALKAVRAHRASQIVLYGLLVLIMLWLPTQLNQAANYTLGTVMIYVLLGLGLNIVVGLAGLLDLGYVAFFAVGAYSVALLTTAQTNPIVWNFWAVVPLAVVLAATAGVLLGVPVLRLRGDYLAIVTLGFGEIIRILAGSDALTWFTAGPEGVTGIPLPRIFGLTIGGREFVYLLLAGVALVIFVTARLQNSRIGRAWVAMREDETVALAMGINTLRYKLLAFGIGAAFAGLGGAMFSARNQFTNPQDYALLVSINVLAVVIVGGMGSIPGVILGAFALKGIPEVLREFQSFRIILFGALLVVMMILRPEGIWPSRRRRLEMHEDSEGSEDIPPAMSAAEEITR